MKKFYIASDYSGLSAGEYDFYFGYEEVIDDEWAFVVKKKGQEVWRTKQSELGIGNGRPMEEYLLQGIGMYFDKLKN